MVVVVGGGRLDVQMRTPGLGLATLLTLLTTLKLSPAVNVVAACRHKYQVSACLCLCLIASAGISKK